MPLPLGIQILYSHNQILDFEKGNENWAGVMSARQGKLGLDCSWRTGRVNLQNRLSQNGSSRVNK